MNVSMQGVSSDGQLTEAERAAIEGALSSPQTVSVPEQGLATALNLPAPATPPTPKADASILRH
jgi:uncharacterized membrane protein YebE (DUF533 family)